jgi:phage shock protein A
MTPILFADGFFTSFWGILGIVVAVLVIGYLLSPRSVKEAIGLARSQVDKGGRWLGKQAPGDRLMTSLTDARESLKKYNNTLTLCNRTKLQLQKQIKDDAATKGKLEARIKKAWDEGKTDDDPEIKAWGVQLAQTDKNLTANQTQLEQATTMYTNTLKEISKAHQDLATAETNATSKQQALEMSQARREFAEQIGALKGKGSIAGTLSDVKRFQDEVDNQIRDNEAAIQTAQDLVEASGGATPQEEDFEEEEAAADALANLRNKTTGATKTTGGTNTTPGGSPFATTGR